jgi:hypothetical protein
MSTEQEATGKEHGTSGKRHCFGINGNGARNKRQRAWDT